MGVSPRYRESYARDCRRQLFFSGIGCQKTRYSTALSHWNDGLRTIILAYLLIVSQAKFAITEPWKGSRKQVRK